MSGNGRRDHMEKPLLGAVLCCTTVPPEQRTRFADLVTEMGGEHKLDLTSDVTHLLVEISDARTAAHLTAKYKYVAANREDVRVLQPAWLEAVRECWMTGDKFNLQALEEEYKLPLFAGLSVCLTGFDDLVFRAQLQERIIAHGGDYRGDLTKTVTHLIANAPEGKKYQYAEQWRVRVVSLRWFKDCLDRGMVLEESLYHPTLALEDQGKGAWNRAAKVEIPLGKRLRDGKVPVEAPRKLRRTASSKLESQSDTLWDDIMGGGFDARPELEVAAGPSRTMSAVKSVVLEPESFITVDGAVDHGGGTRQTPDRPALDGRPEAYQGYFADQAFLVHGFPTKNRSVLRHVLQENGALLVDSVAEMSELLDMVRGLFVIVPYSIAEADIPVLEAAHPPPRVVTDMWIERCLAYKSYLDPAAHPVGVPVGSFPIDGFGDLHVNSTGFENIELLHLSKLVRLAGATYDETLQPKISVLICNPTKANPEKQRYAGSWGIPVVSEAWLWACLHRGRLQSFDAFRPTAVAGGTPDVGRVAREEKTKKDYQDNHQEQEATMNLKWSNEFRHRPNASTDDEPTAKRWKDPKQAQGRPGADFLENHALSPVGQNDVRTLKREAHRHSTESRQRSGVVQPSPDPNLDEALPLQEIFNHSPPKAAESSPPTKTKKKSLFRSLDGVGSAPSTAMSDDAVPAAPAPTSTGKTQYVPPQADSINDAIHDLLNMTSKARASVPPPTEGTTTTKTRLLGRALSNLSNYSRQSRASSVDSLNTDGMGSVIGAEPSQSSKPRGALGRTGSFTGRAKAKAKAMTTDVPPMDPPDPRLCRDEFADEEPTPLMTQLGYGEHEDAVKIREKLAEKRRNRSRHCHETEPLVVEEKRIKDDEAILGVGWGTGRRTRQRERSPQGMAAF